MSGSQRTPPTPSNFNFPTRYSRTDTIILRARVVPRFAEPNLFAKLEQRMLMGEMVVDPETVTRDFPEGIGAIELLCIYQIANGRIQKAYFSSGKKLT